MTSTTFFEVQYAFGFEETESLGFYATRTQAQAALDLGVSLDPRLGAKQEYEDAEGEYWIVERNMIGAHNIEASPTYVLQTCHFLWVKPGCGNLIFDGDIAAAVHREAQPLAPVQLKGDFVYGCDRALVMAAARRRADTV